MRAPSLIGIILLWLSGIAVCMGLTYLNDDSEGPEESVAHTEPAAEIINIGNCRADNLLCIHKDVETGCHYVRSYHGGVTPRLRADGSAWCDGSDGSQ